MFFWKTHLSLKKTQISNFERFEKFCSSSRIFGKFAGSSNFSKLQKIFQKYHLFFERKTQISNVLRNLSNSVDSKANFQPLAIFKKSIFFPKNPTIFQKKPKIWKFWEILLFQSHSTANLLPSAILKNSCFFERHLFFIKKPKISSLNVLKIHAIPVAFYGNFSRFRQFQKRQEFFWKNHLSFEKTPKFWTFRESYQFSRILWQICYLWRFLKNWRVFLKDTSKFNKKPKILTLNVLRILALPVAFFGNFASSSNFSKCQNFFRKNHLCFERKTQILNVLGYLENSVAFSSKLATFSNLKKTHDFFLKGTSIFY